MEFMPLLNFENFEGGLGLLIYIFSNGGINIFLPLLFLIEQIAPKLLLK
jgi:hypothetical protein